MTNVPGVFCLEGDWFGIRDNTSIEPVLQLLKHCRGIPYIYRDVGTREEFDFYIQKWTQKQCSGYPILYLAFHGAPGLLYVGQRKGAARELHLEELAEMLEGKCDRQVIFFSTCSTMDIHGSSLNAFLRRTGAVAAMGYRDDVDWIESAAFDVLLLGTLQDVHFTPKGMEKFKRRIDERAKTLADSLGFRIITVPR